MRKGNLIMDSLQEKKNQLSGDGNWLLEVLSNPIAESEILPHIHSSGQIYTKLKILAGAINQKDNLLSSKAAISLFTFDFLSSLVPLPNELFEVFLQLLASKMDSLINSFINKAQTDRKLPLILATIWDRKYLIISGDQKAIDLEEGKDLNNLNGLPVESISYNLTSLWLMLCKKLYETRHGINTENINKNTDLSLEISS